MVRSNHSMKKVFHETDTFRIRFTPSTDPDWDRTTTEQTDNNIIFYWLVSILKMLYF